MGKHIARTGITGLTHTANHLALTHIIISAHKNISKVSIDCNDIIPVFDNYIFTHTPVLSCADYFTAFGGTNRSAHLRQKIQPIMHPPAAAVGGK